MKERWAIAVVDAAEYRDWKIKKIQHDGDDEFPEMKWNYLIKLNGITSKSFWIDAKWCPTYKSTFTEKDCLRNSNTVSMWKTYKHTEHILNRITAPESASSVKRLSEKFPRGYSFMIVNIAESFENEILSQVEQEKHSHNLKVQRLLSKLK